ncbi:MAG: hypothetical protein J6U68_00950 [Clostridia bacterium]|nr:hypothetical protein [Clostridia bacterium]
MSIQLANDEKIIRQYDYATATSKGLASSTRSKTLIVTNKRIIHKEVSEGNNTAAVNMSEMPVKSAKFVNTSFKRVGYPMLVVIAIILAFMSIMMLVASGEMRGDEATIFTVFGVLFLIGAVVCVVLYIKIKNYLFACTIDTDTHVTPAFGVSSMSGSTRTRGLFHALGSANRSFAIKVKIDSDVAQQMANELGYVIAAAANGDFDEIA